MVLQSLEGLSIAQAIKFTFITSNNEVEYEVVLLGLRLAKDLSMVNLELRCDSQLVASQLYEAKNGQKEQYLKLAQSLIVGFTKFEVA